MKNKVSLFLLIASMYLVSCDIGNSLNNEQAIPTTKLNENETNYQTIAYSIEEFDMQDLISLTTDQMIQVHDAHKEYLFYEIIETRFIEQQLTDINNGSSFIIPYYVTIEIGIIDTILNDIIFTKTFDSIIKCVSGSTDGKTLLYSYYKFEPEVYNEITYIEIVYENDSLEKIVFSSYCNANAFLTPFIKIFSNGNYIYSYQSIMENNDVYYGINTFDGISNNEILHEKNTDKNELLRTVFSCYGDKFAFFCKLNDVGTIIVGNENDIITYLPLNEGEKIDDYSILPDALFLCLSVDEGTSEWHRKLVYRDFDNNDIAEERSAWDTAYYRMQTFSANTIITTTNRFANYIISYENGTISKLLLEANTIINKYVDGKAVGFFVGEVNSFYAFFLENMLLLKIHLLQ
ncbi:MAG: hypothetical protein FWG88_07345 [Oscillospiraceae bacterium]|nr:hypothetical protein [Oscillospiraceae bacterium]